MKKLCPFLICFLCWAFTLCAQKQLPQVQLLTQGTKTSLRGLSVVNDRVVWVSGSNGTVGRSTDGGNTFKWFIVKGFEKADFRDIEAFDAATAIIMAISEPAYILKTIDGGTTWKVVYENKTTGMFLDAMEFWNDRSGIVIGDPVNGRFFIARTFDGGNTWNEIPDNYKPKAATGEALFASSGTNIQALDKDEAVFVTGGLQSKIYIRDTFYTLPVIQGKETTGANSIAVLDKNKYKGGTTLMVVGGDFTNASSTQQNCFYSSNRGLTWRAPKTPPTGYRSCVEYLSKKQLVTCGLNGVDYTFDGGKNWKSISKEGFHACGIAKAGDAVFLAGGNGKVGKLITSSKKKN